MEWMDGWMNKSMNEVTHAASTFPSVSPVALHLVCPPRDRLV